MRFASLLARALARLLLAIVALSASGTVFGQTVSVIRNFNDGVNESTFAPPDSDGTVGPSNFIEFINSRFIVFDKTTSHTKLLDTTDTAFWQGVNNPQNVSAGLTDTHVIYDYNSQRYFAVEITEDTTNNKVLIARTNSAGADPTVLSNWTATSYTGIASNFADFPMVGIDANALYISSNNFNAGGSATNRTLTSIPKTDLLLSTPSVLNKSSTNRTSSGDSPEPVLDFSPTKGAGVFVGVPNTINNSTSLVYTKVTGTGGAGATFGTAVNVALTSSFNAPANWAPQPDGTVQLDNGDGRIPFRGYQVGNDIWLVQAVAGTGGASARSAVAWYRINYNAGGTPSLTASGLLQDTTGHFDYFNPSVAANVNGDVVISVSRSGDSTTGTSGRAGAYAFVGFTSGATTTFGSATLLQAGLTNGYHLFGGTGERWGDYSAVSVDPNDQGDFWLINEYAVNSSTWADNISALSIHRSVIWNGGGTDNNWSTKPDWDFLPTNDDDLTFAGTTRLSPSNDSLSRVGFITFSNTAGAFTLSGNAVTIAGGITNNSTNTQTIGLNLTLSAAQQFMAASGNLAINGTVDNGGNVLTVTGTSNTTLAGTLSGAGALAKIGAGTLVLSGNNSYSGGTTLSNGTLQLGHNNGLGSATAGTTISGGTLDLNAFSPTIGALNGNGGVIESNVAGAASLTVGNGGAGGAYSGQIQDGSGTVGFIKTGAGTQILSGNNSYRGGTTVTGGTLQLGHASALGHNTGPVTVNSGTLDLHGFSPTIGALNGSGGTVRSNVAGAVALTVGNGGGSGSYGGVVANGSGTVSLIKTGAGSQTVSGNNSYSGGTTVNVGTLIVGHVNGLGTGGLTINSTSTARLQAGLTGPVQLPSLTLAGGTSPTATLDVTDNNMIVHNGNLTTLTAQAQSGLNANGTLWTGLGINSSTAAADTAVLTAVGIIPNDDGAGSTIYNTWPVGTDAGGAVSVTITDVLVKYTYFGDADLSGNVDNSTDYGQWLNGYASNGSLSGWLNGDFNYDGTVDNSSDYGFWLNAYANQGSPLAIDVQPVPEPSALVLAALGLMGTAIGIARRRSMDCMKR